MHDDAPVVLSAISQNSNLFKNVVLNANPSIKSRAFNSDKVSAHHAIIPTQSTYDVNMLKEELKNVYFLIARAYIAQFYPKYEYEETTIITECSGHQFKLFQTFLKYGDGKHYIKMMLAMTKLPIILKLKT